MPTYIEVEPETAERLADNAKARGMSVDDYLRGLLEEADAQVGHSPRATLEEFGAALDALAEGSEDLPVLPPEANSRAFYYEDHD